MPNALPAFASSALFGPALGLALLATPALADDGFRPLTAFHSYATGAPPPPNWRIEGDTIMHTPGGGDIVSNESFADFELDFDWKISPGGNSGVMYRVIENPKAAPSDSGLEYQILDNHGHSDGKDPLTSAASAYAIYAPSRDMTKPVGDWNSARIIARGNHVEHWLNGVQVLSYELGSPDWKRRVAASKFAHTPTYGASPKGGIDLQDHGFPVSYRNMRIKVLE